MLLNHLNKDWQFGMVMGALTQRSMRLEKTSHLGMMIVAVACWCWMSVTTFGISVMGGTTQLLLLCQHWVRESTASAPTLKKQLLKQGRQAFSADTIQSTEWGPQSNEVKRWSARLHSCWG
jgi:hypothetical protein